MNNFPNNEKSNHKNKPINHVLRKLKLLYVIYGHQRFKQLVSQGNIYVLFLGVEKKEKQFPDKKTKYLKNVTSKNKVNDGIANCNNCFFLQSN